MDGWMNGLALLFLSCVACPRPCPQFLRVCSERWGGQPCTSGPGGCAGDAGAERHQERRERCEAQVRCVVCVVSCVLCPVSCVLCRASCVRAECTWENASHACPVYGTGCCLLFAVRLACCSACLCLCVCGVTMASCVGHGSTGRCHWRSGPLPSSRPRWRAS